MVSFIESICDEERRIICEVTTLEATQAMGREKNAVAPPRVERYSRNVDLKRSGPVAPTTSLRAVNAERAFQFGSISLPKLSSEVNASPPLGVSSAPNSVDIVDSTEDRIRFAINCRNGLTVTTAHSVSFQLLLVSSTGVGVETVPDEMVNSPGMVRLGT